MADFGFAGGVEGRQDSAVFAQGVVHVAHVVGFIAVEAVVERHAALVAAKLFVRPSFERLPALEAYFGDGLRHEGEGKKIFWEIRGRVLMGLVGSRAPDPQNSAWRGRTIYRRIYESLRHA